MDRERKDTDRELIGAWTKRCYFAGRAVMDSALRPYDLGSVQWYVLYQLATAGPTMQRDLVRLLTIERATMTGIVATLVRKGLVGQEPDRVDQRQKLLRITATGAKLWGELPDLSFIRSVAFDGIDEADIAVAVRVLQTATERLENQLQKGTAS
ncbi:MarR family transcriptional regulator [Rhizobium laguerreae]|jgi:DNA-binding MarR family transcriptional regulator|uniref:DNA-binding MarR family transcriptional regulator n=2 Tax=Rhizobium laguerreae TaxID=1076926 RepID=A0A1S9GYU0_9HYPH|nr:MarR family transcriptional regulator [Rhizobium laguerreae]MBY3068247.1 winged helix DNA-binding protein [Rhizobium laguerreae]MBY3075486.1 winged helix DNA-binding protein [Rhizobium laguerreae]MBY3082051.1 winged helix DNA-binding protein [Rhizobium laguerreae]MBY3088995.1 winged helix DNA-binding protein [Rhizobium laguerreae]MBY3102492.1 winged helix DNA-binding protein [Rhizobium laguerreae]